MRNLLLLAICILASGCTMNGGKLATESLNKVLMCTDNRDGSVFYFNTNTITNFRRGFGAPHEFDVVTHKGVKMHLSTADKMYVKCEEQKLLGKSK